MVNRLIWRGESYTASPIIQGLAGYKFNRFVLSAIGVYAFTGREYHELDLIAEYSITKSVKTGIIDYFGLIDSVNANHSFFDFSYNDTKHMFDYYITYAHQGNIPFELLWSIFIYGPDKNVNNENIYSSYVELSIPFEKENYTIRPFIGGTPYSGFYASKPAIVNSGIAISKSYITNSGLLIPASISICINPYKEKAFMMISIGIM